MANDTGTTSAPHAKADGKSGNVSGAQAVQMIVKRQSEAAPVSPPTADIVQEPAKPEPKETAETVPSEESPKTPQPETGEVKPEAAKPEAETPPDEVLSQLSQEQRERIDKRIAKEVGKRKALEDEIARLRVLANSTKPAETKPVIETPVLAPTPDNPLADVNDLAELNKRRLAAEETKFWAQEQLDQEDLKEVKVGDKVYDRSGLKTVLRNSDRFISRFVPERAQFLQAKAQAEKQTAEMFSGEPWMQDRTSEGYQLYQQILRDPDLGKRANAAWTAAVQVQGLIDVQKRMKAAGKPAEPIAPVKPRAPASQTATGAGFAPERTASGSRAVKDLEGELNKLKGKKGVTGREVEAYLLKVENARSTR